MHVFVIDHLAHAVRGRVKDYGIGRDLDSYCGFTNFELHISRDRGRNGKIKVGDHGLLEACGRDFDLINADGQRGKKISSSTVGLRV